MKYITCAATVLVLLATALAGYSEVPRNIHGAHLLTDDTGVTGMAHLKWARNLVGKYGYCKTLFMGITTDTKSPAGGWVDWVNACYEMDMIPVCRLAGQYKGDGWIKPEPDADGSYKSIAEAVKRVVSGLPRTDKYPLYIEVWNEPNLGVEWNGKPNMTEYANFFVEVSIAIRSIGDSRIKILNGAFGLSAGSTEECIKANPEFINAFDVWASHPYPENHPPEYNNHDGTAKIPGHTIDGYLLETDVIKKHGRKDFKVMITETGHFLGADLFQAEEGYPPINEYNRADYMMRAYRDYWEKWPEVIAVFPFQFCSPGWLGCNWVQPDSGTLADGSPTKPHYQYTLVSKMAKSSDTTGAITGRITDSKYDVFLEGAEITLEEEPFSVKSDPVGNYIWPKLKPGTYNATVKKNGFDNGKATVKVEAGKNAVANVKLDASQPGSLTGVVLNGLTNEPVAGAVVKLTPGGASAKTDAKGVYKLDSVPPVPYSAEASFKNYNNHVLEKVDIVPNGSVKVDFKIADNKWAAAKSDCSNPSFELITNPPGQNTIAARWEPQGPALNFQVAEGIARTGVRSQSIIATPGKDSMLRMISHYGYSKPGATYMAGVWVKTDGVFKTTESGAYLSLDFQDNGGQTLHRVVSESVAGTRDWVYLEATGVAPWSQRISVVLHLAAQKGTAYFDDAYLGMVKPAPDTKEDKK